VKAQPVPQNTVNEVADVVPILIPMAMWDIMVRLGQAERCAPGEVLDKALCRYLEEDGGKRLDILGMKTGDMKSISKG
jgi:hypothetical protein